MDKKCTLIAAALMVAGVFSANAQSSTTVPEAQWKAGNYYYLKTGSSVLSLSGEKADSVIVKTLASDATKAGHSLTLPVVALFRLITETIKSWRWM